MHVEFVIMKCYAHARSPITIMLRVKPVIRNTACGKQEEKKSIHTYTYNSKTIQ